LNPVILVLIVILAIFAIGALPPFGFHNYGFGPSGVLGAILVVILIMLLVGRS